MFDFWAMDFQSAMETFAEAWVAANTKSDANHNGPQVCDNFYFPNSFSFISKHGNKQLILKLIIPSSQ